MDKIDLEARIARLMAESPLIRNTPRETLNQSKAGNLLDYHITFRRAMMDAGLVCDELPIADGQIHRFHVEGDRRGSRNGWYILFPDDPPAGSFGSWKNGEWHKWCAKRTETMTKAERVEYRKRIEHAKVERDCAKKEAQAEAKTCANEIWETAKSAPVYHPYLVKKGIKPYGIRVHDGALVIPMRDTSTTIQSLQLINIEGKKRFLPEGAVRGHHYTIGKLTDILYIVEGYATGASVHEATGCGVVVAFDAGNLLPVAKAIREKYPDHELVIAGDDDAWTKNNPGVTKATEAAKAVNAKIAVPQFEDTAGKPTDFNDLHRLEGLDAVRNQLAIDTKQDASDSEDGPTDDFGTVPYGYTCGDGGVRKTSNDSDKPDIQLTLRPVWVEALSRDGSRENWGRLICWQDHDGERHERAVKAGRMHSRGNELAQELADAGLPIVPGKEVALLGYLAAFNPDMRLIAAVSTGWMGETFVLPDQVIGESKGERIIFQPAAYHAAADAIYAKGSLGEWKLNVAAPAETNALQRFTLSSSFVPPLRHYTKVESSGIHIYGGTSSGKTAAMQLTASAWGNAADPAQTGGDSVYIRRWNMTRHGMEGVAEAHNDLPLIIDEIGEGDGEDFGKTIYKVMSGTGRERADRTGGARKRRHWRTWIMSAGEVRVSTYIEESGQKVRGGQLVRLIDIPADSIFRDAAAVDRMKDACANYFGTAGPAFVEAMIRDGIDAVRENLKQLDVVAERIGDVKTNEERRIRKRFALVAIAGEMAITMGILPWEKGTALSACQHVFGLWKGDSQLFSDAERGIVNVRAFILKHGASRFERDDNNRLPVRDRAGWYRDGCYCFTKEAFAEACNGVLPNTVKNALSRADLLHLNEPDRLVSKIRVDGGYTRVVSIKETILDEAVPNVPSPKEQVGTPEKPMNKGSVPAVPAVPTEKHQMQMKA